jgi:formylglycine-generating enzyme required for sulfatase activity
MILSDGMVLVRIAPGRFRMGSSDGASNETPVHDVTLTQVFWMGRYEVTQGEWQGLMGGNPSRFREGSDAMRRPVESVSWDDAVSYCTKLTSRESSAGRLPRGYEYRLPTEAEWEYCCRAGSTTRYSFGEDAGGLGRSGWFDGNSGSQTNAVGGLEPNVWGLYDMHGNVVEWCLDAWDGSVNYPSSAVSDPYVASGPHRVLRGGSWLNASGSCRAASRYWLEPGLTGGSIGLRVVCAPVRGR